MWQYQLYAGFQGFNVLGDSDSPRLKVLKFHIHTIRKYFVSENCYRNNCQYDADYSWNTDILSLGRYVSIGLHIFC